MQTENKNVVEYTMEFGKVNSFALLLIVPIIIVLLVPFGLIWNYETFKSDGKTFINYFLPIFFVGIIVHEFLHGITWAAFAPKGMKSIKFGVKWKQFTPYCHCKE